MPCKNCKFNFDMLLISINGFDMKSFLIFNFRYVLSYVVSSINDTCHSFSGR